MAHKVVQLATDAWSRRQDEVVESGIKAFVVPRASPFRIVNPKFGQDVIQVTDRPTGLFNPSTTILRVAHSGLDLKFAKSVGARLREALSQLPSHQDCVLALGSIPKRIALSAIERRIDEAAYDHILAFLIKETNDEDFQLTYRPSRRDEVRKMVGSGPAPLFAT